MGVRQYLALGAVRFAAGFLALYIIARSILHRHDNTADGYGWYRFGDDESPSNSGISTNGYPMINESIDVRGNSLGDDDD
jgi:hypothetical protein